VINANLAEAEPDLTVGGEVLLEVDGHRQAWQIVGIATTTTVGPVAYVPASSSPTRSATGDRQRVRRAAGCGRRPRAAADRLGASARDAGLPVGQVQTNAQLREGFEGIVTIAIALLLFIGAILGVVAIIGVAGTMTLGVFEQTREIGVLRTLGATTWAVRRLLLLQGVTVAGVGGLIGIVLSLPVAWLLGGAMEATVISPAQLPTGFSWLAVAIWIPQPVAIGALGATQPARIAARLTVRDTLAYEFSAVAAGVVAAYGLSLYLLATRPKNTTSRPSEVLLRPTARQHRRRRPRGLMLAPPPRRPHHDHPRCIPKPPLDLLHRLGVDTGYLLLGFPLGVASFVTLVAGSHSAPGLAITLLGFPILAGSLRLAGWFAGRRTGTGRRRPGLADTRVGLPQPAGTVGPGPPPGHDGDRPATMAGSRPWAGALPGDDAHLVADGHLVVGGAERADLPALGLVAASQGHTPGWASCSACRVSDGTSA
jgi:hypothetical protein